MTLDHYVARADILLVGCGSMGMALATGIQAQRPHWHVLVVDRNVDRVRAGLPADGRIRVMAAVENLEPVLPSMTILAVKPQAMAALLPRIAALPAAQRLVVSVVAGISVTAIGAALPSARIVRAMPNTPARVGAGATGLWAGPTVTARDRLLCEALFGAVGIARWVSNEAQIDAVTALSGSGPAYVFALAEVPAQAGVDAGLGADLASELARATITGAASLLKASASGSAALKAAVRSPGGTTDAALRVFEDDDALRRLFGRAVTAAPVRAKELSRTVGAAAMEGTMTHG